MQKSPRRPREALGMGGLPEEVGGGTSALLPSVFLYLWSQIFTEEQMGHGFGTSLLPPKVCACPLEVFIAGDRWGRPSFPSSVRGCGRDGATGEGQRRGSGMFCILPFLQSCTDQTAALVGRSAMAGFAPCLRLCGDGGSRMHGHSWVTQGGPDPEHSWA